MDYNYKNAGMLSRVSDLNVPTTIGHFLSEAIFFSQEALSRLCSVSAKPAKRIDLLLQLPCVHQSTICKMGSQTHRKVYYDMDNYCILRSLCLEKMILMVVEGSWSPQMSGRADHQVIHGNHSSFKGGA
jgi:hypothetical protein